MSASIRAAARPQPRAPQRLSGKVALITGATSGIGRAIALGFAAEGARVAVAGRSRERGDGVVHAITSGGGTAEFFAFDVSVPTQCTALVRSTVANFGRLDVLVNAAGVFPVGPAHEVTHAEFDRTINTNMRGAFFCGQAAINHMLGRGTGGRIINLASIAGLVGIPQAALYSATKGALVNLTKAWGVEYAPYGIRVNAIAPGNVETPMNAAYMADPAYKARMIAATPAGRNGQVEDIVPTAVLLASDDGDYFCGATLVIDGGWVAQ